MSLASREALNKLINRAEVAQFATHAEDWSTCSTTDLLAAAADEPGKLAEREAYVSNTGTARADWTARPEAATVPAPTAAAAAATYEKS